jgi:nucleoside-diphosphate-sugar epimerase
MRIFMTGATGYIGSVVTEKLLQAGHQIVGLARSDASAATLQELGVEPRRGDLGDTRGLTDAARAADAVIHNAYDLSSLDFAAANAEEAAAVAAMIAGLRDSDKPLVFTSGTGVLGDTGTVVHDEEDPVAAAELPDAKAVQGRLDNERTVLRAAGPRGIVVRPPNVYGRGDGHGVFWTIRATARKLGAVPYAVGSEDHLWSFVHVDDLAGLFVLAVENAPGGELFHAGAQSGIRTRDIAVALSRGMGLSGRTIPLEMPRLAEAFGSQYVADYWSWNSQSSSDKARRVLGWEPRNLDLLGALEQPSHELTDRQKGTKYS